MLDWGGWQPRFGYTPKLFRGQALGEIPARHGSVSPVTAS
jgi:hypothetical protein